MRKSFRDWAGAESREKRVLLRNLLSNAASIRLCDDDVVRLFSELHFAVVATIYNAAGITRADIWQALGKPRMREDSAEADLFKLLIRDLSTGGLARQHRDVDYSGNFVRKRPQVREKGGLGKSAFDSEDQYELTALGNQFVHYAMTDVPVKLTFNM